MLLFEEIRVEQEFPWLVLRLSWGQGLSLYLIPVLLKTRKPDLAGFCNSNLDEFRPFLIQKLGFLINLRLATLD